MNSLSCRRSPGVSVSVRAHVQVGVQEEDFDLGQMYVQMRAAGGAATGAIALFVGLVRDRNERAGDGSQVASLTLEHYPGMTEKSMLAIAEQACERWPLVGVHVVHRVGTLPPEAQIVAVLVASAHRDAAFAGAEFIMDYLKTDAVFWKKEAAEGGESWLQSTEDDAQRAENWREQGR